jgi:hypothetical protein
MYTLDALRACTPSFHGLTDIAAVRSGPSTQTSCCIAARDATHMSMTDRRAGAHSSCDARYRTDFHSQVEDRRVYVTR